MLSTMSLMLWFVATIGGTMALEYLLVKRERKGRVSAKLALAGACAFVVATLGLFFLQH